MNPAEVETLIAFSFNQRVYLFWCFRDNRQYVLFYEAQNHSN